MVQPCIGSPEIVQPCIGSPEMVQTCIGKLKDNPYFFILEFNTT